MGVKYAPKKVFIKENKNYIEIINEERERRKATHEQYAKNGARRYHGGIAQIRPVKRQSE